MTTQNYYIGLISGTSMDGIDAALVDLSDGYNIVYSTFTPYRNQTHAALLSLLQSPDQCSLDQLGSLDHLIGHDFAHAALDIINASGLNTRQIAAIGSHGQTIQHCPPDGAATTPPYTLQIGDPNIIAEYTGITTVADFRRRDMAAGGQGAPLVPAFHAALIGQLNQSAAIVNIGGIANITIVGPDKSVIGFDIGPGNCLMDQWMREHFDKAYDQDGSNAAQGTPSPELLARLLDDPYFKQRPPKSSGPEYFNLAWLRPHLAGLRINAEDVLRSLNQLTAASICSEIDNRVATDAFVYLCGGGVHNTLLLDSIRLLLPKRNIATTAVIGIDPDFVEAATFAWLAQQTLSGNTGNIPTVTGAKHAVRLGAIYPASSN